MTATHVALTIGGLFLLSKWSHARAAQQQTEQAQLATPYAGVTDIWNTLNGGNWPTAGSANAHPAYIDYTAGASIKLSAGTGN